MKKDKAKHILQQAHPNKINYTAVKGIFKQGVQNRYQKNLQRWYLKNSSEIKIDDVLIGENDFFTSADAKTIETNKINFQGIPLEEIDFIRIQLEQSRIIFEKTINSELNLDTFKETEAYIKHLEQRKKIILEHNKCKEAQNESCSSKLSKENLIKEQNKLIPKVSISEVFNHFEILTKTTNKNDEFYLTNEQLFIFVKATFIDLAPIKQNFNCRGIQKNTVRKIFYNFYFDNKNNETNHTRLKRKYYNIMDEAFNGFNKNDYTDFAK